MIVLAAPTRVVSGSQLDDENPWPGLASYDETSHRFFSGRATEVEEVLRRIVDEPVTVLFGKSGLGKTSLLSAGVFPRLRERDMLPVVVRLHVRGSSEPLIEQVSRRLLDELRAHQVEHAERIAGETLWEYLHRTGQEFWTTQNRLVRPVFVFDQFEELYTLGCAVPGQVDTFREDLADLAENRIPAALVGRHAEGLNSDPDLNTRAMPYKIVIALREDFLADLECWRATMPSLRRNRMRLLPMQPDQALEAVYNERTNHLVSEPLARKIVGFLSTCASSGEGNEGTACGANVEPALLSLFCRGINEQRKRAGKTGFDPELLEGAKATIVRDFYVDCLADQPERVRRFIEDELITESGYRNSYAVEDATRGGAVTTLQLDTLVNRHLLRYEHHLGTDRVELTHDLLTRAVLEERDLRVCTDRARRERRQRLKFGSVAAAAALIAVVFAGLWASASRARIEADQALSDAQAANTKIDGLQKRTEGQLIALQKTEYELQQAVTQARTNAEIAGRERDRANAETNRSRSRELAAHAEAAMNRDPELAIALGLEAMERADTTEARSALIEAARYAWPYADLHEADLAGVPRALALSRDGGRLVVLAGTNAISVWDVTRRKPVRVWPVGPQALSKDNEGDPAASVAFSPDETVIAVGRQKGVDLVDADSGRVITRLPQFSEAVRDRRIVYSPDGQWLASNRADDRTLLLANLTDQNARPELIKTGHAIGGFAVLSGGKTIVTVGGTPLAAYKISKVDGDWSEAKIGLMSCVRPQSVSPGAAYVSATWNTSACITPVDENLGSIPKSTEDGTTDDIVWSTGGGAFVELVASPHGVLDLVVGRRNRSGELKSRIKGAHPMGSESEKSRLVSISETGTRAALIDHDDHKLVRVYSVAGYKPFLSAFQSAASPDGSWIALARPGVAQEQKTTIEIIPLEQAFTPNQLSHVRARISINRPPRHLYASSSSLVVVHFEAGVQTTSVFDAVTGEARFEPLNGAWRPLDSAGEQLLLLDERGRSPRVVGTRDGAPVENWRMPPAVEGRSPRGHFEIRQDVKGQSDGPTFRIMRRHDRSVIATSPHYRFSADDRWLAVWDDVLTVFDLSRGEAIFRFAEAVEDVTFAGEGILHVRYQERRVTNAGRSGDTASMLIPLDWRLTERFLRWLTARPLTSHEECIYGLRGKQCWNELPLRGQKAAH